MGQLAEKFIGYYCGSVPLANCISSVSCKMQTVRLMVDCGYSTASYTNLPVKCSAVLGCADSAAAQERLCSQ